MTKKEVIKYLRKHLELMPKQALLNLLDCWDGKTPKLYCEPSSDCENCRFPLDRVCDEKDCGGRFIDEM